ncbi:MAG: DUF4258 domain-containing protein [Gammaproteobacteria bacterium]|nr:DUF4258 domain-containing protein [Gammaproteobacteria bacterium]MBU1732086.1 DUF4258 domain-containing protein [Gammaproteobacteria bacterium]MBU1893384.1 DUF4258 domain-containing protein [Gammaproteobacteria bacterium]
MKLGKISSHARVKMRQRGITEAALQRLLASGRVEQDHLGGKIVYFDHEERARPEAEFQLCSPERSRDAYAVMDCHGEIITVGSRFSRVRKH